MNGELFATLTKLTRVYLSSNDCISGTFSDSAQLIALRDKVNDKCYFDKRLMEIIMQRIAETNALKLQLQQKEVEIIAKNKEIQFLKNKFLEF